MSLVELEGGGGGGGGGAVRSISSDLATETVTEMATDAEGPVGPGVGAGAWGEEVTND